MSLPVLKLDANGDPLPCQIFFQDRFYWLLTKQRKSEALGANPRCATFDGARAYWENKIARLRVDPNLSDRNRVKREDHAQGVINELIACGAGE